MTSGSKLFIKVDILAAADPHGVAGRDNDTVAIQ